MHGAGLPLLAELHAEPSRLAVASRGPRVHPQSGLPPFALLQWNGVQAMTGVRSR